MADGGWQIGHGGWQMARGRLLLAIGHKLSVIGHKLSVRKGRWLRGVPIQLLLWTTVPATLILIVLAVVGVVGHQRAMRELVQVRDARLAQTAAERLSDRLDVKAGQMAALAAELERASLQPSQDAGLTRLDQHAALAQPFDRGMALISPQGQVLGTLPHDPSATPSALNSLQNSAGLRNRLDCPENSRSGRSPTAPAPFSCLGGSANSMSNWSALQSTIQSLIAMGLGSDLSNTLQSSPRVSAVIDDPAGGTPLLLMAVPAGENWLVGGISLQHLGLSALVAELSLGVEGRAYVIDETGQVLVASEANPEVKSLGGQPGVEAVLQGEAGALITSVGGTPMVIGYAPVPVVGWALITQEPWSAVVGPMMRFSLVAPLILVVAAIAALITIVFGLRSIVRPLQQLDQQAAQLAWGNFEAVQTPVGGTQEIEDLRRTLDDLARQIRSYQQGMRDYIGAITRGQEEERKRLARELHDDTVQDLIALGHRVEMARRVVERDPAAAAERLQELKELINATLTEVRRFTRALRPIYLEDLGLLPALEMLVHDVESKANIASEFQISGPSRRLPEELELAVYRIAQEALTNVVQHARATRATVKLHFTHDEVTLTVTDDGIGFAVPERPEGLARAGHFGLVGMQERAALVGGRLVLEARAGRGTWVTACLPVPPWPHDPSMSMQ